MFGSAAELARVDPDGRADERRRFARQTVVSAKPDREPVDRAEIKPAFGRSPAGTRRLTVVRVASAVFSVPGCLKLVRTAVAPQEPPKAKARKP